MTGTTDLRKLKEGAPFTWGKVVSIQTIGRIDIVAFRPWVSKDYVLVVGKTGKRVSFHPFVDGEDQSTSFKTLNEALVFAVAISEGVNINAAWPIADFVMDGLRTRAVQ